MERKRHYRRLDQLRELLISHGVELLLESNPDDRDAVTFARVFERVEAAGHPRVTKGSVLGPGRAWSSQRQFQLDVEAAAALALGDVDMELTATLAAAAEVLDGADLATRAGRARVAQQLCRRAGEAYFHQLTVSKRWRLWVGLWGRLAATGGVDDEGGLGTSLRQAQLGTLRRLVDELYAPLADVIGYRARPEYGSDEVALSLMAVAGLGVTDGLAIHQRLFPEHFEPVLRPTGPGGRPEPWHPFAIAFEALVNQYLEPAPARSSRGPAPATPATPARATAAPPPRSPRPSKAATAGPSKAATARPAKVATVRPSKAATARPAKVATVRPAKVTAAGPLKVTAARSPRAVRVTAESKAGAPNAAASKAGVSKAGGSKAVSSKTAAKVAEKAAGGARPSTARASGSARSARSATKAGGGAGQTRAARRP